MALLTLVPKCENAQHAKDFRPIACCSVLYKIISKVLANRVKAVLDSIISESQSAFVQGRMIFDNVVLSHELVKGYTRKNISPRCMVKVDLQKAYDSVEWPFLEHLLLELGFPYRVVKWIMACVTTVSYTISVNGDLTAPFQAKKGLRQGDPISPYLFVICMEYLSRCLKELHENRLFHYHPRCKRLEIIHMCFADDLLLFTRGDVSSIQQLLGAFWKFSSASGLQANQQKSCIYFGGVKEAVKGEILRVAGMGEGNLPFKYLGVPLSTKKLSVMQWQPLINKIKARIDCWASKLLSYAGRVQLIKSVLVGIQIYWSQLFLIPQKVLRLIQAACRTFLWTGKSAISKRALVAWDRICMPKSAGGLGMVELGTWNKAAICKMFWNLAKKKDVAWIKWVHEYYIKSNTIMEMPIPGQCSWIIKKILGAREYCREMDEEQSWVQQEDFSIQQMYSTLKGEVQRVPWHKMVCQNPAPPKCVFIVWLLLQRGLATCENLHRAGIMVDPTCCFCEQGFENLDHLFFGCEKTGEVWSKVAGWCGLDNRRRTWNREQEYLITQCTTKSGRQSLYRCAIAVVVYLVWKERNLRRMQGRRTSSEEIVRQCQVLIAWCGQRNRRLGRVLNL